METNYSMDAFAVLNGTAEMLKKQKDTINNNPFIVAVKKGNDGIAINICANGKDFDNLVTTVLNAYVQILKSSNKPDDYITYKLASICADVSTINDVNPMSYDIEESRKHAIADILDEAPDEVKEALKGLSEMLSGGVE